MLSQIGCSLAFPSGCLKETYQLCIFPNVLHGKPACSVRGCMGNLSQTLWITGWESLLRVQDIVSRLLGAGSCEKYSSSRWCPVLSKRKWLVNALCSVARGIEQLTLAARVHSLWEQTCSARNAVYSLDFLCWGVYCPVPLIPRIIKLWLFNTSYQNFKWSNCKYMRQHTLDHVITCIYINLHMIDIGKMSSTGLLVEPCLLWRRLENISPLLRYRDWALCWALPVDCVWAIVDRRRRTLMCSSHYWWQTFLSRSGLILSWLSADHGGAEMFSSSRWSGSGWWS